MHRFDVPTINNLGAIAPALGIFYVILAGISADLFLGRANVITLARLLNLTGLIILSIWNVPEASKWFAYSTTYSAYSVAPVLYGWANSILRHNVEERALTLVIMTAIRVSTNAWIPLLIYPTIDAPKFPKGFPFSAAMVVGLLMVTQVIRILDNREEYVAVHPPSFTPKCTSS